MKKMWTRMWSRKWLIVAGTMVIFLSLGAVGWAASGVGAQTAEPAAGIPIGADGALVAVASGGGDPLSLVAAGTPNPQAGAALKGKLAQRVKRLEALMKLVRDKMTPEDQAAYDGLVQTAKDQRVTLQQARQDLTKTLKDLRDLTNKYIDVGGASGGSSTTATTAQ
jgi:hypothetical protein